MHLPGGVAWIWNAPLLVLYIWAFGPCLMVLFEKVIESFKDRTLLKEESHLVGAYNLVLFTVCPLLLNSLFNVYAIHASVTVPLPSPNDGLYSFWNCKPE